MNYTPQQLKDWEAYERIRKGGRYNMFDPRARRLTGLSADRYSFVLQNYSELRAELGNAPDNVEAK